MLMPPNNTALQLGLHDQMFTNFFCSMRCNLKNARSRNTLSKITKWPSLRPLALKSKFIWKIEFSETLEDIYGHLCCWRARPCSLATYSINKVFDPYANPMFFPAGTGVLFSNSHKISFFNARLPQTWPLYAIFVMLLPFLAFFKF